MVVQGLYSKVQGLYVKGFDSGYKGFIFYLREGGGISRLLEGRVNSNIRMV